MVLERLLWLPSGRAALQDNHVTLVESVYEAAVLQLQLFYRGSHDDEIFLDMFEDEYRNEEVSSVIVLNLLWSSLCVVYGGSGTVSTAGGLHAAAPHRHTSNRY